MATRSVSIFRHVCSKTINLNQKNIFRTPIRNAGYLVLLPEIPRDSPEANSLLRISATPSIQDITPEKCMNAIVRLTFELDAGINRLEESLKEKDTVKFEDVIEPLEKLITPLDYAWCLVKHAYMTNPSEDIATVYKNLYPRVQSSRVKRFNSYPIYQAISKLGENITNYDFVKQRVIKKYMIEGRLNGLSLSAGSNVQNHFIKAGNDLKKEKAKYRFNLTTATNRFKHDIFDYEIIRNFPEDLLRAISADKSDSSRGPWRVTLDNYVYEEFLKYCPYRDLRHNVWRAFHLRASAFNDTAIYNSIPIEEIRFNRRDMANLLGFSSFAEMSMLTKMAGNVETVKSMISSLRAQSKPKMDSDIESLQKFAGTQGFKEKLELWDIPFWRQNFKTSVLGIDEHEMRRYFPLNHVLDSLFQMCQELFNIKIKKETLAEELYDSSVSYYNVLDDKDNVIGSFYLDLYKRVGKMYFSLGLDNVINRCDALNIKPIAFLNCSFTPPTSQVPCLLTYNEVILISQKFGSALQHLCTKMSYSEVAGSSNLEWDAVHICSYFLSYWIQNAKILQTFTNHYQTNKQLSITDCESIIKGHQYLASFDLTYELYLSQLDLEFYSKKDFWLDITKAVFPEYFTFNIGKGDSHPCSFSAIFSDNYSASYFSFTWAKMIAADAFCSFEETGLDNKEEIQLKGKRFRETFLALGGGCHPNEVFRLFRGRDPSPNALLYLTGISTEK